MLFPGLKPTPRATATPEQIRTALAAARASLPELSQETVAAGMALAGELALTNDQRSRHAREQGTDMAELHRANRDTLAALRAKQDEIAAMEAALPLAVERERREQAEGRVRSANMVRENRLRAFEKRRHEVIRDAQALGTCLENLRNRRRSLSKALAELEIKDVGVDHFIHDTFEKVFSANDYNWRQLSLDALADRVGGRIEQARAELEAAGPRSVDAELADQVADEAFQARVAAKQAADSIPRAPEPEPALPAGHVRRSWPAAPPVAAPRPSGQVEAETTYDLAGRPMVFGELPSKVASAELDAANAALGEAPQMQESPDPSDDTSEAEMAPVDPVSAEPPAALVASPEPESAVDPEPAEIGTDNPDYQAIAAKYRTLVEA